MAEDVGDKTEAATPRRRQEAREEGTVARSHDLSSAALLVGLLMILRWFGQGMIGCLHAVVGEMLGPQSLGDVGISRLAGQSHALIGQVAVAMSPFFIGVILIGVAANVAQVGFVFNFARLTPNFAALNPTRGFSRLFGGGQGVVGFLMNLLKMTLVGLAAYSAVNNRIALIVAAQRLTFLQIFSMAGDVIYAIALRIGIVLLVLAIIDYIYQRYRIEQQLKMSKQEVKEEMRRMDGDPKVKQRRRQIAVQRAMQKLKKQVPTADVVVTNPTHFSVALKYNENDAAPHVVAKGADFMAFRIRELAIASGIPIVERPPLARAIFRMVDVGEQIPEEFYAAVAEILAYVYELNGKTRRAVVA